MLACREESGSEKPEDSLTPIQQAMQKAGNEWDSMSVEQKKSAIAAETILQVHTKYSADPSTAHCASSLSLLSRVTLIACLLAWLLAALIARPPLLL